MLQCVAVCFSVMCLLQCVAVCCSVLQCVAVRCRVLQCALSRYETAPAADYVVCVRVLGVCSGLYPCVWV